jgi:hypothetical protein
MHTTKGGLIDYNRIDPEKLKLTGGKLFEVLDHEVPSYVLELLNKTIDHMIENVPADAVYDDMPGISHSYTNEHTVYRRWSMHVGPEYTKWLLPEFEILDEYLLNYASNIYNFKFIMSSPRTEIVWHEQHPIPRIHFPLQADNTVFDFMDEKRKMHSIKLEPGKMYMLNVCYPHRIRNMGKLIRKQAFFECDYVKM